MSEEKKTRRVEHATRCECHKMTVFAVEVPVDMAWEDAVKYIRSIWSVGGSNRTADGRAIVSYAQRKWPSHEGQLAMTAFKPLSYPHRPLDLDQFACDVALSLRTAFSKAVSWCAKDDARRDWYRFVTRWRAENTGEVADYLVSVPYKGVDGGLEKWLRGILRGQLSNQDHVRWAILSIKRYGADAYSALTYDDLPETPALFAEQAARDAEDKSCCAGIWPPCATVEFIRHKPDC